MNDNSTSDVEKVSEHSPEQSTDPIAWFRQASPYIKSHRNTSLVLHIDTRVLDGEHRAVLAHDLALLSHLGVRLILVPGLRTRIDKRLAEADLNTQVVGSTRVTDAKALEIVTDVAGQARIEIECLLSMGLVNTPMAGAHLSVISGNFVTAQPVGIRGGIDCGFAGEVRKVQSQSIKQHTASGDIVLLLPIGYSRTGEMFNLQSEMLAAQTASALHAEKLVYLSNETIASVDSTVAAESSPANIRSALQQIPREQIARQALLAAIVKATDSGVSRVHVLDSDDPNALLQELFSRDGAGTLVSTTDFDTIRSATIDDVGGIIELIAPLEKEGALVPRSREQLEREIGQFIICEREGMVTACAAMIPCEEPMQLSAALVDENAETNSGTNALAQASSNATARAAEIACVATHPIYRDSGRADQLLCRLEQQATRSGIEVLYVLTTRTGHWFIERGYTPASPAVLPGSRSYNLQRNSRVLLKTL